MWLIEILRHIVRLYAGAVSPGFFLVHGNTWPHVARVCQRFSEDEGIDTNDWPSRSLDMNPVEHLWDIWINALSGSQTHPGQSRSSPIPMRSGGIWILGNAIDLSEACLSIVERAFKHLGVIPAINVSFQYDWLNGRNFGTNPYLDYHFVFRHDFGNLSSNGYSPCALANLSQYCSR